MLAAYISLQSKQLSLNTATIWTMGHHCLLGAATASWLLSHHHVAFCNYLSIYLFIFYITARELFLGANLIITLLPTPSNGSQKEEKRY